MLNLRNLKIFVISVEFLLASNVMAIDTQIDNLHSTNMDIPAQTSYQNLKNIAEKYVAFLYKVGQSNTPITQDEISQLFAPECKKIVNGILILTSSSDLPNQLNTARNATGKWNIKTLLTTVSPEDKACTIQIKWDGANRVEQTTMMVLRVNEMGKITEMHEVYNTYNKSLISEAYSKHKEH